MNSRKGLWMNLHCSSCSPCHPSPKKACNTKQELQVSFPSAQLNLTSETFNLDSEPWRRVYNQCFHIKSDIRLTSTMSLLTPCYPSFLRANYIRTKGNWRHLGYQLWASFKLCSLESLWEMSNTSWKYTTYLSLLLVTIHKSIVPLLLSLFLVLLRY